MAWYDTSYKYKKPLTVDHTKVSGGSNLSNFPVLISLTDTTLKTVANGGNVQNANGYDIIFTDSTETTKLDHEIESYTASTGAIVMWVRLPTLSASVDTVIYLYCDNPGITTSQQNATGVWDTNYKAVWHLGAGTGSTQTDSTGNAVNLSPTASPSSSTGQIDGGLTFNGTSQNLINTSPTALNFDRTQAFTISYWVKPSSTAASDSVCHRTSSVGYVIFHNYDDTNGSVAGHISLLLQSNNTGNYLETYAATTALNDGNWHLYTCTYDGSSTAAGLLLSQDGVALTMATSHSALTASITNAGSFALASDVAANSWYAGQMDEVRISTIVRSTGWTATEYNNQSSPSTFLTVGVATLLASFTDALTIADISGGTLQCWPVDALTTVSSFSQSESYLPAEGLVISDIGGGSLQRWNVDALTLSDQAVMSRIGAFTDSLAATDSFATTETASTAEALTAVSSSLLTQALSSLEALTIASTLSGQRNYQTSDQATVSSAFSSTPTFAPTDLLTIGSFLLQTETSTWSDVLSISSKATGSGGFAPSDLLSGSSQLQETDAWTMLDALSIADSATWSQDNLGVPTTTYSFLEQLSISSFFAAVVSSLLIEGLSISSQATSSNGYAASDALSILSSFIKADEGVFAEPLMLTETTITASTYQSLDQLIISASMQNTSSMQVSELLSVLSSLLGTDAIAIVEPLTVTDSSTMTSVSTGATYSFLEQLIISSLFNGVQIAALTETLVAQSILNVKVAISFSDLLIMSDTGQIVQTPPFIAPLYARSTLTARDGRVVLLCRDGRVILISRGDT